jgi:hypothetical protein
VSLKLDSRQNHPVLTKPNKPRRRNAHVAVDGSIGSYVHDPASSGIKQLPMCLPTEPWELSRMPSRRHIGFPFAAVFVFVSFALTSTAKAQSVSPVSDQMQIVRTVSTVFAAVRAGDSQELDSVVTPDFYIFDGGVRLNADSLMTLMKARYADTRPGSPISTRAASATPLVALINNFIHSGAIPGPRFQSPASPSCDRQKQVSFSDGAKNT